MLMASISVSARSNSTTFNGHNPTSDKTTRANCYSCPDGYAHTTYRDQYALRSQSHF